MIWLSFWKPERLSALRNSTEQSYLNRSCLQIHWWVHSTKERSLRTHYSAFSTPKNVRGLELRIVRTRQKEGLVVPEGRCWRYIFRLDYLAGHSCTWVLLRGTEVVWVLWYLMIPGRSWCKFLFRWKCDQLRPAGSPQPNIKHLTLKGHQAFMKATRCES